MQGTIRLNLPIPEPVLRRNWLDSSETTIPDRPDTMAKAGETGALVAALLEEAVRRGRGGCCRTVIVRTWRR